MPTSITARTPSDLEQVRRLLDELPAAGPTKSLGSCPACGRRVLADGHCIRLHGAFFHTACALYQRESRAA